MSKEETQLNHSEHPEYGDTPCTDMRGRLYIRRTSNGSTVWHCHDCSAGGCLRGDQSSRAPRETVAYIKQLQAGKTLLTVRAIALPPDMISVLPIPALIWLHKYGITAEEIETFRFGWSPFFYKRLILPVYDQGRLVYWQGRTFEKIAEHNPKYLNIRQSGVKNVYFRRYTPGSTTICIVEDILSAVKVGRFCDTLALLGSYLPPALIQTLSSYERVYLWLDEDKFKTSIKAMQDFTQMTGVPVIPLKTLLDPKALDGLIIQQLLNIQQILNL